MAHSVCVLIAPVARGGLPGEISRGEGDKESNEKGIRNHFDFIMASYVTFGLLD